MEELDTVITQEQANNKTSRSLFGDVKEAITTGMVYTDIFTEIAPQWAAAYMLSDIAETLRNIENVLRERRY